MPVGHGPGFLSLGIVLFLWLVWLYGSVIYRYYSSVANLMAN